MTESKHVVVAPGTLLTLVAFLLGGALLAAFAYQIRWILAQLLTAVVLAMAMEPPVRALARRGLSRSHAVGASFAAAVVAVATFGYLLLPPLVIAVVNFAQDIPNILHDLTLGQGSFGFLESQFHVVEYARAWVERSGGTIAAAAPARQAAGGFLHAGAALVTIPFLTYFVALSGAQWFEALLRAVPEGSRERWRRIGRGTSDAVGGYVFGNLLISVIAGAFTTAVLLATRVPHPVPLGLIVAVLDLVPLVGATLGAILVAAVALTKGIAITGIVIAAMWLYQQVENNLLIQIVYGYTVRLTPLAIALSVAIGAEIGGIVGVLLAIPVAGAIKVVARELLAWRRGEPPPEEPPRKPWVRRWLERRSQARRRAAATLH